MLSTRTTYKIIGLLLAFQIGCFPLLAMGEPHNAAPFWSGPGLAWLTLRAPNAPAGFCGGVAGTATFNKWNYNVNESLTITVVDSDYNITTGSDIMTGNLHSSATDTVGITMTLNESLLTPGTFTATATIKMASNAGANEIGAHPGETITFSYLDDGTPRGCTASINSATLTYSGSTFTEAAADNGTIPTVINVTLANDTFTVAAGQMASGTHYTTANVPSGLTLVITATSSTTATIQLTGTAANHAPANSISNLQIYFANAAFTGGNASLVSGYMKTDFAVTYVGTATVPTVSSAVTNGTGSTIELRFSKTMSDPSGKQGQFTVNDGAINPVSSVALKSGDTYVYILTMSRTIDKGDTVYISYTAGTVTSSDGGVLANFGPITVSNMTDAEPSSTYSGITNTSKGTDGSRKVTLTITVKNSNQAGLSGYRAADFDVEIDNGDTLDFRDSEFSSFTDNGDGTYTVIFWGDESDTDYSFDIWVDDVAIERDYVVTTPPDDDDDDDDSDTTYTLGTSSKTIHFNGAEIYFPSHSWTGSETDIYISSSTRTSGLPLGSNQIFASDIFTLTKDRSGYFEKDITITLPFDDYNISRNKYDVSIYWLDQANDRWVELHSVDTNWNSQEVSGNTDHFTKFALIATRKNGDNGYDDSTDTNDDGWIYQPDNYVPVNPTGNLTDISGHWAEGSIRALVEADIISGYPDGRFYPEQTITRAEFTVMLVKAFKLTGSGRRVFADTANHWARDSIAIAADNGIIQGYDANNFGPDNPITREEIAVIIANTVMLGQADIPLSFNDTQAISPWAVKAVAACVANGIMKGDPTNFFRPQDSASRAEAATVLFLAWE